MIESPTIQTRFDVEEIRKQFPILKRMVKGNPLVYLDNAATAQKPAGVIDALVNYYTGFNANIHRGIHSLAEEATAAFEATRTAAKEFIHAGSLEEIIFTRGATEGINLVAYSWGRKNIKQGDEIIISEMEHHANIVPWQMLAEEKGALIKTIPINAAGELVMEEYYKLLGPKTKLVSVAHVSNVLGTINPVKDIINAAHDAGAVVLLDGAQSAVHLDINVQELDCDFFVFSGHKLYGPTGTGVLYGKKEILEAMPPFLGGGEMISEVSFEKTTYNELPYKFEAGTPNIADIISLKAAFDFINSTGKEAVLAYEEELLAYATAEMKNIPGLEIKGNAKEKIGVISFVIDKIHPQDLAILLDNKGIAIRTGHHCAQPLMNCMGVSGTSRVSLAMYNTKQEIDVLINAIQKAIKVLG